MNKIYNLVLALIIGVPMLNAQVIQQISVGPSYSSQAYYDLDAAETDASFQIDNDDWDIAFALTTPQESGIHVNESIDLSFSGEAPSITLYKTETTDFTTVIDVTSLTDTLTNNEISWGEGALNSIKDPSNPFDFGWGVYDPTTHGLNGTTIYVIKLKNNNYRKFRIESYLGGIFTIRQADLDGANDTMATINKSDYTEGHLIFYSFENGVLEVDKGWDFIFGRYSTQLDAGGYFIPYNVSGLLSAPGVQVAVASNIDVSTVEYEDYEGELSDTMTTIGHEFKYYDFSTGWTIVEGLAYFVKKENGNIFKLNFLDFEGSSTGIATLEKTKLGVSSSIFIDGISTEMKVFPNPVLQNDVVSIAFESIEDYNNANLSIIDMNGRLIYNHSININNGLNGFEVNTNSMAKGNYILRINAKDGFLNSQFLIQ